MSYEDDYIATYLKLDVRNPLVLRDLIEIRQKDDFIAFMKANVKNIELDYLNPLQKLNKLCELFYRDLNRGRFNDAHQKAWELAEKFRNIKPTLRETVKEFKDLSVSNIQNAETKEMYFSGFEISSLSQIGSVRKLISIDDSHNLEEEIEKVFNLAVERSIKGLGLKKEEPNNSRVLGLANMSVRKM